MPIYAACVPAFTVCEAFAAEAYLKSLAKIESGQDTPDTHNLKRLFDCISPASRKEIRKLWLKKYGPSILNAEPITGPDGKLFELKRIKTFEEALDLSALAFIKWRYHFYEHHGWLMRGLGPLVREKILSLKPAWRPGRENPFSMLNPHPDIVKAKPEQARPAAAGTTKLNYRTPTFKFQIPRDSGPDNGHSG
jgi:hypothetical protein